MNKLRDSSIDTSSFLQRLRSILRSLQREKQVNPVVIPLWRSLMLQPLPFFLWFRLRWHWFRLSGKPLRVFQADANADEHIRTNVIPYSIRKMRGMDRMRTERLINVLRSIHDLDVEKARVLNIGPRNEAEVLLLRLYGFRSENITAVDLFSYSPQIEVMDMHELRFPNDAFDVTYCAYTLRYSDKVDRACQEILRCTRNGGLVAASFVTEAQPASSVTMTSGGERRAIIGSRLSGGVGDLLERVGASCGHVYWREEY